MRSGHIVPLAAQSLDVVLEPHKLNDGRPYLLSNQADHEKPKSENTLLYTLYRMGYHSRATTHGFCATASTILNEQGFGPDVIERQLAATRNRLPSDPVAAGHPCGEFQTPTTDCRFDKTPTRVAG